MTGALLFAFDLVIAFLVLAAAFFGLVGSVGLAKLPDLMTRLHAPTKATTLGVGAALIASMLYAIRNGEFSLHELMITLFLFITAPIVSHMVSKVWLHRHSAERELPRTGRRAGWATFDSPPDHRG